MIRLFLFLLIKFVLGAESGASFKWSAKWQNKTVLGHNLQQLPEILDALILAHMAVLFWSGFFDLDVIKSIGIGLYHFGLSIGALLFVLFFLISYAGIQSATWMFLRWESHDDPNTERSSTTKPLVDFIAHRFGWELGDEGYAWTAATVKGSIIFFPFGGPIGIIGGLMFACGYEIGSHLHKEKYKKYLPSWLSPHAVAEGMSFVLGGLFAAGMVYLSV